jgi:UDP-glucose 4-epimerase|tara:strand:+ start:2941 stop:3786 length:846 start_codon:yes stop_codon:yes gene_type:complete
MKILVTGGAGFIGTNLIKQLVKEGNEVVSLDNYDSGLKENHVDGCKYLEGDISTIEYIKGDFDVCYHLAALSRIQPSFDDPTETFRVNVEGTRAVAEWARHNNVKVVYAGSSSRWHDPYQSPYACFKHMGEEIFKLYKKVYGLNAEIARFYNVYGPGEIVDGDWAAVIGIWRRQVRDGEKITIVGDGEQRRDFTHVDDIVSALILIAEGISEHEDAWELGTGLNYSINEVYEMFKEKFGSESVYIPDQPGNYRKTLRENDDMLDRFGWKPQDRLKGYIDSL